MRDPEMRTFDILSTSLLFWEVLTFLVLLSVGWLIYSFLRRRNGRDGSGEILDRRYANGEMTREEYLTTRDDITRNPNA